MRVICRRDKHRYIRIVIRFINEYLGVDHNTNFCVDTGAPNSLVSYEQAVEWGIPFEELEPIETPYRVGGITGKAYSLKGSRLVLRDHTGKLNSIEVPSIVVLGPPFQGGSLPVPALLGDDILYRFSLIVESDRQGGDITITDERIDVNFLGPFD